MKRRKGELRLGEFAWREWKRTGASPTTVRDRLRRGDYGGSVRVRKENARVTWVTVSGRLPKLPADLRPSRAGRRRKVESKRRGKVNRKKIENSF